MKDPKDLDPLIHDSIRQDIGKPRHLQLMYTIRGRGWRPQIGVIDQVRGAMDNALNKPRRYIIARSILVIGKNRRQIALGK